MQASSKFIGDSGEIKAALFKVSDDDDGDNDNCCDGNDDVDRDDDNIGDR